MCFGDELVSVIIPCYNQVEWLQDAVSSVLASTYQNLEIIVVDDGSTKGDVGEEAAKISDRRLRVIRQANQGVCFARNNAIKDARGEFILTLDADDVLDSEFIERAMRILTEYQEIDQVGGNYVMLCDGKRSEKVQDIPEGVVTESIMANNFIPNAYIFRKNVWKRIGGFSRVLNRLALEDVDFTMSFYERGLKTYLLSDVAVLYRQHGISRNTNNLKRIKAKFVIFSSIFAGS